MVELSKSAGNEVAQTKMVTVFSTLGKNAQEFQSSAVNWAGLQKELSELQISHSGMKAVIGETRLTIESPNAVLPITSFSLYLMPIKTKSGMADRKELFVTIKAIVTKNPEAKNHFVVDGKNMTQLTTQKLEELLSSYSKAAHTAKVEVNPTKKKENVVAPVTEADEYLLNIEVLLTDNDVDSEVVEEVIKMVKDIISIISVATSKTSTTKKTEEKAANVETAAQKLTREMSQKANDLMSDFNDVRR